MQVCLKWCLVCKLAASYLQLANDTLLMSSCLSFLKLRNGASSLNKPMRLVVCEFDL